MDMASRVVLATGAMAWLASPAAGAWRKPLDRDGGELARATTIVRYGPGAAFKAHFHEGGEEIFVLDGVFEDDAGSTRPAHTCATRRARRTRRVRRAAAICSSSCGSFSRVTPTGFASTRVERPGAMGWCRA